MERGRGRKAPPFFFARGDVSRTSPQKRRRCAPSGACLRPGIRMRHLLLAAAFALAAASAAAQPGPLAGLFLSPMGEPFRGGEGAEAWFARADADHDGVVTAAEFQAD